MTHFGAHQRSQTFPSPNDPGSHPLTRIPANQSYIDLPSSSIYSINTHIIPEAISYTHRLRTRSGPAATTKSDKLSLRSSSIGYQAGNRGPLGPFSAENRSRTSYTSITSDLSENMGFDDPFDIDQDPFIDDRNRYSASPNNYHILYNPGYISPPAISTVSLDLYLRDEHPAQETGSKGGVPQPNFHNRSDPCLETPTYKRDPSSHSRQSHQNPSNHVFQTPTRTIRSSPQIDSITRDLHILETPRSPNKPKTPESQIRLGSDGVLLTPGDVEGVMGLGIVYPLPPKNTPGGAKRRVLSYHSSRDPHISPQQPDTPVKKLIKAGDQEWRARYRTNSIGAILPPPTNRTYSRTYRRRLGKYPFNHTLARLLFYSMVGFLLTAILGIGSNPDIHTPAAHWESSDMWMVGDEGQVFGLFGPQESAFAISSVQSYDDHDLVSIQRAGSSRMSKGFVDGSVKPSRMIYGLRKKGWRLKMRKI